MRLPTIEGIIRRRILANFRVDPRILQRQLPERLRPKLHDGAAVAGICLIRLESIRPKLLPDIVGISSENAAHRMAVMWNEDGVEKEGVFITRRDTNSALNSLLGGRLFPGVYHQATFNISESDSSIELRMESADSKVNIEIEANLTSELPQTSIFKCLAQASSFFEAGSVGYSVTHESGRLDGMKLQTNEWRVQPLDATKVYSSYFSDESKFPKGSIEFDHALLMRNVRHEWHTEPDLYV